MAAKTTKEKNPLPKLGRFYEITFQDTMGLSFRGLFGFPNEDKELLIEVFDCFFNHRETRNQRVQEILNGPLPFFTVYIVLLFGVTVNGFSQIRPDLSPSGVVL